jgi:hypothetical protein
MRAKDVQGVSAVAYDSAECRSHRGTITNATLAGYRPGSSVVTDRLPQPAGS